MSAAERSPDAADSPEKKEQVIRLNVEAPGYLGKITREKGILLIYISTGICLYSQAHSRLCFRWKKPAILSQ